MQVERIEDWTGQDVRDGDGERIGKLEDVFFAAGSEDAQIACVKTGMLGRKSHAVPLAGATVARDHITVAFSKEAVTSGPEIVAGQPLEQAQQRAVSEHFGEQASGLQADTDYESARTREENARRARELSEEVRDLDEEAAKKRAEERDEQSKAQASGEAAEQLEQRKRAAEAEARQLED